MQDISSVELQVGVQSGISFLLPLRYFSVECFRADSYLFCY